MAGSVLTVVVENSWWAWEDVRLERGRHEVDTTGKPELRKALRDAAAAGVGLRIEE